jgi:hypothetical protein
MPTSVEATIDCRQHPGEGVGGPAHAFSQKDRQAELQAQGLLPGNVLGSDAEHEGADRSVLFQSDYRCLDVPVQL